MQTLEQLEMEAANRDGSIEMVWAKLHGIRVTESKLDYHGSITIDEAILEEAGIIPLEFAYIWNKQSGARISTYILPGERGSGVVCLNGAAARTCQAGDEVIVTTSRRVTGVRALYASTPRVLTFDNSDPSHPNRIAERLEYRNRLDEKGHPYFEIATVDHW